MFQYVRKFAWTLGFASMTLLALPLAHGNGSITPLEREHVAETHVNGAKSKTVALAVRLVAKGIRLGNKHFAKIVSTLDAAAAGPFLKHSGRISDLMEEIASIPDVAERAVGEKLFYALSDKHGIFKLSPGTANVIRQAIMGAVSALL